MEKRTAVFAVVRPPKLAGVNASALRAARATRAGRTRRRRAIIMVQAEVLVKVVNLVDLGGVTVQYRGHIQRGGNLSDGRRELGAFPPHHNAPR